MPAPVVTRLIEVEYAGLVLGGSGNYQIHEFHEVEGEYAQLTLFVDVIVRDTTTAGCKTLAAALEAAWEKPDQDLRVTIDGENYVSLTQAGHTGMNGQPKWRLVTTHRSKKSRLYRCSVTVLRPATLTGKGGRQSARWTLTTDDVGIRTVTIKATYTALPAVGSATTVVAANFATYAGVVQAAAAPGGEFEEPSVYEVEPDDNDKVATVLAVYREIVYPQSGAGTDDASIVSPQYEITTYRTASPQLTGANAAEPVSIAVSFSMGFRLALVARDSLQETVEALVLPYLTTLVRAHSDAPSAPVLVEKNVKVDPVNSRAAGVATFTAFGTSLVRCALRVTNYIYTGNAFVAVMDGRPFSRDHQPSPGIKRRRIVSTTIELASDVPSEISQRGVDEAKRQAESEGFHFIDEEEEQERFERRMTGSNSAVRFLERARALNFEYAELRTTTGGGASPGLETRAR